MDGRENDVLEITNEAPDYGELVIEMVHRIKNQKFWHFIYDLINSFIRKWGI